MIERYKVNTLTNLTDSLKKLQKTLENTESAHKGQVEFLLKIEAELVATPNKEVSEKEKIEIIYGLTYAMIVNMNDNGTTSAELWRRLGVDKVKKIAPTKEEWSIYLSKAAKYVGSKTMALESDNAFKSSIISQGEYQSYWKSIIEAARDTKNAALDEVATFDKERKATAILHGFAASVEKHRTLEHMTAVYSEIEVAYRKFVSRKPNQIRSMQLDVMAKFLDILKTNPLYEYGIKSSAVAQAEAKPAEAKQVDIKPADVKKAEDNAKKAEAKQAEDNAKKAEIALGFLFIMQETLDKNSDLRRIIGETIENLALPTGGKAPTLTAQEKSHHIRQALKYLSSRTQENVNAEAEAPKRQWKKDVMLSDATGFDLKGFIKAGNLGYQKVMFEIVDANAKQFKKPESTEAKGSWVPSLSSVTGMFGGGGKTKAPEVVVPELATAEATKP